MRYFEIRKDDTLNGVGNRVVLFVSGCNHKCDGCQNPQTWDCNNGNLFTKETRNELIDAVNQPHIDGVTFSGGDPLHPNNIKTIQKLANEIHELGKSVWLYTGYVFEKIPKEVAISFDVIVDGPYIKELNDVKYPFAGSTNQRVIDVKKSLLEEKIVLFDLEL